MENVSTLEWVFYVMLFDELKLAPLTLKHWRSGGIPCYVSPYMSLGIYSYSPHNAKPLVRCRFSYFWEIQML